MPREEWELNTVERLFADYYPDGVRSILDVGCGLSMKSQYLEATVYVGVDIHRPYLEQARKQSPIGDHFVLINADVNDLDQLFLDKSFDVVVCFDVLEHLKDFDGRTLIAECERLARKAVCIETPNGYVPQDIDITGLGGDVYQTHRSAWQPADFQKRGYTVKVRDYLMNDVRRHTSIAVDPHIQMIDAIKRMDTK
jgi:2-polyprenyl-3-methyl-5-hydroxy-6-metoxy-1,4-benzoquinol methylase